MKLQSRMALWMSIIISVVIVSGLVLSFEISSQYSQNTLNRAIEVNSNFILTHAKATLQADDFLPENFEQKRTVFSDFFTGVDTTEILRIKVWSTDGTIVYSDDSNIVGENFFDNENFQTSLAGEIAPEIKEPVKPENIAETGYGQLMELYVPITDDGGQIIGVIETYTSLDFVNSSIAETNSLVSMVVLFAIISVSLVVVLVFVSLKRNVLIPLVNIQEATKKIANGDFDIHVPENGDLELKELSADINIMANELSKQRKALIHAERLSAIGELAARLAHDIRNPLNVIKHTIRIIKKNDSNSADESNVKHYSRLQRSIKRISHQIDEVMDFIRVRPIEIKEDSLKSIIQSSVDGIDVPDTVKINLPNNDVSLLCDSKQMEVVFVNLISNSLDAMKKSGEITIRTKENDDKIIIEFEDSGPGIPNDKLLSVFDPLYTTKQNGTGLGLVSCREIIKRHHGTISVENNPTRFIITLPRSQVFDYDLEIKRELVA